MSLDSDRERIKQVEKWLRCNYPLREKVVVRVAELQGDKLAMCSEGSDGKSFWITVRKGIAVHEQIDSLLHEWAHIGKRRLNHGQLWGRRYQVIYQHWFDRKGAEESRAL